MPKISNIELLETVALPTLTIRTTTQVEKLPVLIGDCYHKIAAYLQELGELPSDIPFVAYHNLDMLNLDVEIGFPVSKPLPDRGDIKCVVIPAGKIVFCMYLGPYKEMAPLYNEMAKWISDNGYVPTGTAYEYYYNGPDCPERELLTKIAMPIRRPDAAGSAK